MFVPPAPGTRLPFYIAAILLFVHFARLFDVILVGYKIPAIVCILSIIVAIFAGGLKLLRSRVGIAFLLLIGWMSFSAVFSTWRGGSAAYVLWYAQFFLPLMLLVAIASKTPRDIVKLSGVLAFSLVFHLLLNGREDNGRYGLSGTTFGNPDDVALLAGFAIPFVALICTRLRNSVVGYTLLASGCSYLLWLIGRTATRAAIPALIAMLGVYFFRSKGVQKLAIVAFSGLAVFLVILLLPANTLERLSTVVEAFSPQQHSYLTEAEASALDRHDIMRDAIKATLDHPIVGVGAGMFVQYRFDHVLGASGLRKHYEPSHNTYLEIASEGGFPGVIFYLVFLWAIHSQIRAARKLATGRITAQAELLRSITMCLEAALVYFAVCAAFMTCDKHPHQFVLAGFAIALQKLAASWMGEDMPVAAPLPVSRPMAPVPFVGKRSSPVGVR